MSLDSNHVRQLCRLARLALGPEQEPALTAELQRILAMVDALTSVPTDGVEPLAHPQAMVLRLRPDEVTEADRREALQASAPAVAAGYYLVPKVIE